MSKRSRAIELWATMKYLGKKGINDMVTTFNIRSKQLAKGLSAIGFRVINEVVFNQILVALDDDEQTKEVIRFIQQSGESWLAGSMWQGKPVIRVSICQWRTSEEDIEQIIRLFKRAMTPK